MKDFTSMLKEFASQRGADLVGIANVGRFEELPTEKHPSSIFPEAKSVVVLGRRITRGTLRGMEEGMSCVSACPSGAIPHIKEGKVVEIEIEGQKIQWGDVDMGNAV